MGSSVWKPLISLHSQCTFSSTTAIYNLQFTIFNLQFTIYNLQFEIYNLQSKHTHFQTYMYGSIQRCHIDKERKENCISFHCTSHPRSSILRFFLRRMQFIAAPLAALSVWYWRIYKYILQVCGIGKYIHIYI